MNNAVACCHIRGHHVSAVYSDAAIRCDNFNAATLQCFRIDGAFKVRRHHFAGNHVVKKNCLQLLDILRLKQAFYGSFGQSRKGLIRGRENG